MPEKTLKEKVVRASLDLSGIEVHYPHIDLFNIQEALTALEERVKELEKERALVADWYEDEFCGEFERFVCVLKEQDAFRKEAPDDGK